MSLTGSAKAGGKVKGKINRLEMIRGYSAYEIAVINGFSGTEEEWLTSLEANPERIKQYVNEYLEENPTAVDTTLTVEGEAADAKATGDAIRNHAENQKNPHNVTKEQIGLGKVDNTADTEKPVSTKQAEAIQKAKVELQNAINTKAETAPYYGTLLASGWSGSAPYSQTIIVPGLLATDNPFVDINLSDIEDGTSIIENWILVGRVTVTADNTVVAYCYEDKPEVDIPIILKVVR